MLTTWIPGSSLVSTFFILREEAIGQGISSHSPHTCPFIQFIQCTGLYRYLGLEVNNFCGSEAEAGYSINRG